MTPRVFIIHGYEGSPDENWLPWLKDQLEGLGCDVCVPAMPHPEAPQLTDWLAHLCMVAGDADEQTYFIGHSLGCATILRFIEQLSKNQRIGGAVLVAAFAEPIHFTELDEFTKLDWNDEFIKRHAGRLAVINSDNDEHVPLAMGERIRDRFGAKLVVMHNAGHIAGYLSKETGYFELPEAVREFKEIAGLAT